MVVAHPIDVLVPLNFRELGAHRPGLSTGGFGLGTGAGSWLTQLAGRPCLGLSSSSCGNRRATEVASP